MMPMRMPGISSKSRVTVPLTFLRTWVRQGYMLPVVSKEKTTSTGVAMRYLLFVEVIIARPHPLSTPVGVGQVGKPAPRGSEVPGDALAAGLGDQGRQQRDGDRLLDEADGAVGEGDVGAAGVEAVDVPGEVVAVDGAGP